MSFSKQTENKNWKSTDTFCWNEADVLGKGATAVVYKARRKPNGCVCAVKYFHERVSHHFASVALREIDLLKKLEHRNVITIYAVEKDVPTGNFVMGMELCEGGSLYSMLDQPKYSYGLPEDEFLVVLFDIASGMKYLRQIGIIHRDLKPGNIMRFIDDTGQSIYKLTDFGAARQLDDEENFTSIYGTEEYLDPNMYEKAVLRRHSVPYQEFDASVDIWSLGVTIYHVATGHLPFQPYGGRSNSQTMFLITTTKESGVISGIQRYQNGDIEWNKELPGTCRLSLGLKCLVVPMLANMMESDKKKRWTFEIFFGEVFKIKDMLPVRLYDCSVGSNLKVYVEKNDRYAALQEKIAMESDIPSGQQLILFQNRELEEIINDITCEVQNYPTSILHGQLFLYNKERIDVKKIMIPDIPQYPSFPDLLPIENKVLDKDSHIGHKSAAVSYLIELQVKNLIVLQELMQQAERCLREYIQRITRRINNCIPEMCKLLDETKKRTESFFQTFSVTHDILVSIVILTPEDRRMIAKKYVEDMAGTLRDQSPRETQYKAENRIEEIKVYMSVLVEKVNEQEREAITSCVGCMKEDRCVQKSSHLYSKIYEIYRTLADHRKKRYLSPEEEFGHRSDRTRMQQFIVQLESVMNDHCMKNTAKMHQVTNKQIAMLIKHLIRTGKVDQNIKSVLDCQSKLSLRMEQMEKRCTDLLHRLKLEVIPHMTEQHGGAGILGTMPSEVQFRSSFHPITLTSLKSDFQILQNDSIEIDQLMKQNAENLQEQAESLKELSAKLPKPDSIGAGVQASDS